MGAITLGVTVTALRMSCPVRRSALTSYRTVPLSAAERLTVAVSKKQTVQILFKTNLVRNDHTLRWEVQSEIFPML